MTLLAIVENKFGKVDVIISVYTMQVAWASKRTNKLLGYNPGEMTNMSVRKFLPMDPKSIMELMSMLVGKKITNTRMIMKKSGEQTKITADLESFTYDSEPFVIIKMLEIK